MSSQTLPAPTDVLFVDTFEEADPSSVSLWGGKGAGLAGMTQGGLRVPPGFIVSTEACREYLRVGSVPSALQEQVDSQMAALEQRSGKTFGRGPDPLLLSVRSGAPISMPGMMDTVLNLGLCLDSAVALAEHWRDTRLMADVTARFHAMYSEIVLGALDCADGVSEVLESVGRDDDPSAVFRDVWTACEQALADDCGGSVPEDPASQLAGAIEAVFRSWNTRRAITYRDHHSIPHDLGTAVVVQSMVFGNVGQDSGSGVVFTRNPVTGEPGLFGEYLADSQGEDVVAGLRTPDPVMEALDPDVLAELVVTADGLEKKHGDVLDIEFTVERGVLYFLQVRSAKRTAEAAVRIATDMLQEGAITAQHALELVTPDHVRHVLRPGFDDVQLEQARSGGRLITTGIGACPGQVSGVLILDPDRAKDQAASGVAVILARRITSPADLHGMIAARGLITATGGSTSHAAVVARALGTACAVGAAELQIDEAARTVTVGGLTLQEGDMVSLDGGSGELFSGAIATATPTGATDALKVLDETCEAQSATELIARVASRPQVDELVGTNVDGLISSIADVLAVAGEWDFLQELLHADTPSSGRFLTELGAAVARAFGPLFEADVTHPWTVESLDLSAHWLGHASAAADDWRTPGVLPLGVPGLVEAQVRGLTEAARMSGSAARPVLAVGRVSCLPEASAIARHCDDSAGPRAAASLYSPAGLGVASDVAGQVDSVFVHLSALQELVLGVPAGTLQRDELVEHYLSAGHWEEDPRSTLDDVTTGMVSAAAVAVPGLCVTLPDQAIDTLAVTLYDAGVRRFAADALEVRPLRLALARAAVQA
jgi:pyruvate,orthophosphate dikinase